MLSNLFIQNQLVYKDAFKDLEGIDLLIEADEDGVFEVQVAQTKRSLIVKLS